MNKETPETLVQEAEALVDNILAAKAYIKAAALYGDENPQQVEFCLKAAWDRVGIVAQEMADIVCSTPEPKS